MQLASYRYSIHTPIFFKDLEAQSTCTQKLPETQKMCTQEMQDMDSPSPMTKRPRKSPTLQPRGRMQERPCGRGGRPKPSYNVGNVYKLKQLNHIFWFDSLTITSYLYRRHDHFLQKHKMKT